MSVIVTGSSVATDEFTQIPFAAGARASDLFVVGLSAEVSSITDARASQVTITDNKVAAGWGRVGDPTAPLQVSTTAPRDGVGVLVTFASARVVGPPTLVSGDQQVATVPIEGPDAGAVIVMAGKAGFATSIIRGDLEGHWENARTSDRGFRSVRVATWRSSAGETMPSGVYTFSGGTSPFIHAVTIPLALSGRVAPLRAFPRDDDQGPQTGRSIPPPTSWQSGRRYGGGAIR